MPSNELEALQLDDQLEDLESIAIYQDLFIKYTRERGLETNKQVARVLGFSEASVSYWVDGRLPDPNTLYKISERLNLTAGERENLLVARALQQIIKDLVAYVRSAQSQGHGQTELVIVENVLGSLLVGCDLSIELEG